MNTDRIQIQAGCLSDSLCPSAGISSALQDFDGLVKDALFHWSIGLANF
jgi:hypothetical protein